MSKLVFSDTDISGGNVENHTVVVKEGRKQSRYIVKHHCTTNESALYKSWWRYQVETSSALLTLCEGIHRSPVDFPRNCQWHGTLMFSLICAWINGWANNRDFGDSRRHRALYDVHVFRINVSRVFIRPFMIYDSCSLHHYSDIIMGAMASQITSLTIVYSTVYLGAGQRKHKSSASLALVRGIHR